MAKIVLRIVLVWVFALSALPSIADEEPLLCEDSGKRCHVLRQRDCAWCVAECWNGSWATENAACPPRRKSHSELRADRDAEDEAWEARERVRVREIEREQTESDLSRETDTESSDEGVSELMAKLDSRCSSKWPGDFSMQEYCRTRHLEAGAAFSGLIKQYESSPAWNGIVAHCSGKWSDSFGLNWTMVHYCVERQIESARKLGKL